MTVVYASPGVAPEPPVDELQRNGMTLTWEGADGVLWDLCSRESGVYLLSGVRGMGMPTGTRFRDASPAAHGSQHRGHIWDEREVFWPVKTWHGDKGQAWVDRDRAFFSTMDPELVGRWTVTQPGGESRYLELRYEPTTADEGVDTIPSLFGWARYGIYLTADQPFWVGKPSVQSWKAPVSVGPFYEPTGPHLLNIGQGFTFENAAIDNLGNVASHVRWYVDGDTAADASVGVSGKTVNIPFVVPAGSCLVIESDPTMIGAVMYTVTGLGTQKKPSERVIGVDMTDPVDRSKDLGEADFGSIPPGLSVPLSISASGAGTVEAYVPNLYKRAW